MNKRIIIPVVAIFAILASAYKAADDYFEISKNLDIFATVYKEVNESYVDEVKPGELIRKAVDGMLYSLDPYTNFYSEAQAEDYQFQITGSYGGIGATVRTKGDYVVIQRPYEGFPAQKADLRAGDLILEVDGKSAKGLNSSDLTDLLKGTAGTSVTLRIRRPGVGDMDKTFDRAQIKVKNVPYYGMIDNTTGLIKLTGFMPDAGKEVKEALEDLKKQGMKHVILDLRGNGGGLLHEAVNIVNVFVSKGTKIVETRGREDEMDRTYKTLNGAVDTDIPLAVLIDGGSASASEIVSGSIQDLDRGVVIGRKSYGKGLVQSTRRLTYNTQMKITTAKYYIPSGRCIQKLDYAHKENGKAVIVADSLKKTFYTSNNRPVLDGDGVTPDVNIEEVEYSKVSISLLQNDHIFDYATEFRNRVDSIPPPKSYDLTVEDFEAFLKYLEGKEYTYSTETEKALEDLIKKSEEEQYYEAISSRLEALRSDLAANKDKDIHTHMEEIIEILESEISRRYYYDRAMVETTFDDDQDLMTALAILNDPARYNGILQKK